MAENNKVATVEFVKQMAKTHSDDLRNGANGEKYASSGEAVRCLSNGYRQLDFGWELGQIDANGDEVDATTVMRSKFLSVNFLRGITLTIDSEESLPAAERVNIIFYTEDKTFISRIVTYATSVPLIPNNAGYLRFSTATSTTSKMSMQVLTREYDLQTEKIIKDLKTITPEWVSGALGNDGAETVDGSWVRTKFISIDALKGGTVDIEASLAPNRVNSYWYDKNKNFIMRGGAYTVTTDISINNANVRYVRFTCLSAKSHLVTFLFNINTRFENTEKAVADIKSDYVGNSRMTAAENSISQINKNLADVSIATLNKDKEHILYTASQARDSNLQGSSANQMPYTALGFIHFSDIHGINYLWKRICDYFDHYKDLFTFALHTGDLVQSNQGNFVDLYGYAKPEKPILNCIGNHDTVLSDGVTKNTDPSVAYGQLFSDVDNWGVTRPSSDVMYYYKDFDNVRLIVLDQYYSDSIETTWLTNVLADAKTNGKSVITASHTQTAPITHNISSFNNLDRPSSNLNQVNGFESIIKAFKDDGGTHICHLAGHWHWDVVGTTDNGVLNILVACATIYGGGSRNDVRKSGMRSYDCFNAVFVDTQTHTIRIIRIGSNTDNYLQAKNTLCINYSTGSVVSNT